MKIKNWRPLFQQEDLNFLLTNRVPRIALTRFMGWFSQIRSPLLARVSIAVWRLFTDLDLSDAKHQRYTSLHDCFTRALVDGARLVDANQDTLTSPCDAIVGACGRVEGTQLFQAKGFPYSMADLFGPSQDTAPFRDGVYVTLRLTSSMYHRFHAPQDCDVEHVTYAVTDWIDEVVTLLCDTGFVADRVQRVDHKVYRHDVHAATLQPDRGHPGRQ